MYIGSICTHMGDHARVNLRVEQETKEKWDEFVEESDHYTTLSGMIRAVVNAEVNSGHDETDESDGRQMQADERFDQLEGRLDDLEELLEEAKSGAPEDYVTPVDDAPQARPEEPRPYPTEEVFEALPDGQGPSHGQTARQISDDLEYSEEVVKQTAGLLDSKSGRVRSERLGDQTVYWKEV